MAIGALSQHHPAGDYDISLNDSVGDKFVCLVDSTAFTHLSSLNGKLWQAEGLEQSLLQLVVDKYTYIFSFIALLSSFMTLCWTITVTIFWIRSYRGPLIRNRRILRNCTHPTSIFTIPLGTCKEA